MNEIKLLDLKVDYMFKQLFGQPSRKQITIAFLNDLLGRPEIDRINDISFENTDLIKDTSEGKSSRLDLLVSTSTGEKINVEIQLANPNNMPQRMLFYWWKMYTASLQERESYEELPVTIVISILNFSLFKHETDIFHSKFQVLETSNYFPFSDRLEFHTIDLKQFMIQWKKYRRDWKTDTKAVPWLLLLTAADNQKDTVDSEILNELEEWAMNYEEVKTALKEWEKLSINKENRAEYEWRLKELRDQLSRLKGAREEGRELERHEILKSMMSEGFEASVISKITKIPVEEVLEIMKRM
ncbi:Rpn family recombination-promoting nuclease/putative transposase [Fredinandcohnia salidurans]|uniref:Rpn family recombination-promoting nuclease/putative transposase n=1 Tax=Fredinandcohnia salidurans TaxID=2595041 RepID=A0ABW4MLR6_9BACI